MKHRATKRFWASYNELPKSIRQEADKCFAILKDDSSYYSLRLKKVGKLWSIRIGVAYRALAVPDGQGSYLGLDRQS